MKEKDDKDIENNSQYAAFPAMNAGILSNKAKDDISVESPLGIACAEGKIDSVKTLLNNGLDVNKKDLSNLTPIMHAALNGHRLIIKLLVEHGAKISYALLGIVKSKINSKEKDALYGKEDSYEVTMWRNLLNFLIEEGKKQ